MNNNIILFGFATFIGLSLFMVGFYDDNLNNISAATIILLIISGLMFLIGIIGLIYNICKRNRENIEETEIEVDEEQVRILMNTDTNSYITPGLTAVPPFPSAPPLFENENN